MKKQKSKIKRKQKRPKFIGLSSRPPVSKRYCVNCKGMRVFEYNPSSFHSECRSCGCRESRRDNPNGEE